jgi:hypothetical protein
MLLWVVSKPGPNLAPLTRVDRFGFSDPGPVWREKQAGQRIDSWWQKFDLDWQ